MIVVQPGRYFFLERMPTMLVLTRKINEAISIDGHVSVRVLSIRGRSVKLGIEAPGFVAIRRAELPTPDSAGSIARSEAEVPAAQR
jgi:carbon storage regulator